LRPSLSLYSLKKDFGIDPSHSSPAFALANFDTAKPSAR